jgi:hypothetical protein
MYLTCVSLLSLQSYASILYLRFPRGFRIILRGEDVMHHNIVNDMMMSQEVTYRPQSGLGDGILKDSNVPSFKFKLNLKFGFPNLYSYVIS